MPTDLKKYRHYFDEYDMTDKQKDEFIEALYVIMQSFADQAFDLTPTQQVLDLQENSSKKTSKKKKKARPRKSKKTVSSKIT